MPYKVSRCDQGASKDGSPIAARSLFESELKKQSMGQSMEGGGGGEEGGERDSGSSHTLHTQHR